MRGSGRGRGGDVHEVPPAGLVRVELAPVQLVGGLDEHGRGRALGRLAQLDHESLSACDGVNVGSDRGAAGTRPGHVPIALCPLSGRTWAVVTPPAIAYEYAASWVLSPSTLRSHGRMGPLGESSSKAPAVMGVLTSPTREFKSTGGHAVSHLKRRRMDACSPSPGVTHPP